MLYMEFQQNNPIVLTFIDLLQQSIQAKARKLSLATN